MNIYSYIHVQLCTVDANTIADPSVVSVLEGFPVTISCTSTGAPTPTIEWTFNDLPIQFSVEVISTANETRASLIRSGASFETTIALGNVISFLSIVNSVYPTHDGNYKCTGSNNRTGVNVSAAAITVQVIGE